MVERVAGYRGDAPSSLASVASFRRSPGEVAAAEGRARFRRRTTGGGHRLGSGVGPGDVAGGGLRHLVKPVEVEVLLEVHSTAAVRIGRLCVGPVRGIGARATDRCGGPFGPDCAGDHPTSSGSAPTT